MSNHSTSITAGLVVAVLGAIPLVWSMTNSTASDSIASPTTTQPTITTEEPPPEVLVTTPPPVVEGLSESVVRVLVSTGYALEEQVEDVPESVVRTLTERGIALTIAEGP